MLLIEVSINKTYNNIKSAGIIPSRPFLKMQIHDELIYELSLGVDENRFDEAMSNFVSILKNW